MKFRVTKVDEQFEKELEEIKLLRVRKGIDNVLRSDRRLTKAIRKHSLWPKIKEDILNAELEDEKNNN